MITYNPETHEYTVGGVKKVSVTEVLSNVGTKDENGDWNSISGTEHIYDESYAERGIELHKIPPLIIKGIDFKVNEEAKPWLRGIEKAVLYVEKLSNKKNFVVDWKFSKTFQEYWWMQVAAYINLVTSNTRYFGVDPEKKLYDKFYDYVGTPDLIVYNTLGSFNALIILIQPDSFKPNQKRHITTKSDFNKFLSLLNTYKIGRRM